MKTNFAEEEFNQDEYPDAPRVLFICNAMSTHTHSWIDQLKDAPFNIRVFGLPDVEVAPPPDHFSIKNYVTNNHFGPATNNRLPIWPNGAKHIKQMKEKLYPLNYKQKIRKIFHRIKDTLSNAEKVCPLPKKPCEEDVRLWLAWVILTWKPDIVHTMGISSGGKFLFQTIQSYQITKRFKWALQLRGGSDLQLKRFDSEIMKEVLAIIHASDQIICDNTSYINYLTNMGVERSHFAPICPIPGTGGIDTTSFSDHPLMPSKRRLILWPKAYEIDQSKAIPVIEAFRKVWQKLLPCKIVMLAAVHPEVRLWFQTLPKEFQEHCEFHNFVPRKKALALMSQARIMLAPSLIDGRPNTMLEAMAAGAIPIVSPLDSICEIAEADKNVIFARNLYIDEIATALERAMNDDALVDRIAENNLKLISTIADRDKLKPKIIDFYQALAQDNNSENSTQ